MKMRRVLLGLALIIAPYAAYGSEATTQLVIKDGNGSSQNLNVTVIGGNYLPQDNICDDVTVNTCATVDANGLHVYAAENGTWNITNISGTVSLPTGASTATNQTNLTGTKAPGTAAADSLLAGGVYTSAGITLSTGQQAALQLDSTGHLLVTGSISNASVGQISTAGPNYATNVGGWDGSGTLGNGSISTWGSAPSGLTVFGTNSNVLASVLPTGAATSDNQSTEITDLGTISTNTGTIAGAITSSVVQSNTKQVNGVTTLTGAGATGTGAQRVTAAQDTTTVAGAAPLTTGLYVTGASAAALASDTHLTQFQAAPTASVPGVVAYVESVDVNGNPANFTLPNPTLPYLGTKVGGTDSVTGTSSTSLITAVTSKVLYAMNARCSNSSATPVTVAFQDGSGGTTLDTLEVPAGGGNNVSGGGFPLFWTTSGNALYFAASANATTVYCTASGFSQ